MDIVIIRNNFRTLVDVVIANLTRIDLVQHATMTTHASRVVAQDKVRSYTERTPKDWFHTPCHRDPWLSPSSL